MHIALHNKMINSIKNIGNEWSAQMFRIFKDISNIITHSKNVHKRHTIRCTNLSTPKNLTIIVRIFILFISMPFLFSQDAVHNYGNIQIHEDGLVGFHMDIINNGPFNRNKGLVGFYSLDKALTISGGSNPIFFDFEIAVDNDLYIDNTIGISNNVNFITGNLVTDRTASEININFQNNSFYNGENNNSKVDGYAAISNTANFTFPIGQRNTLRPLTIESNDSNDYAKAAYYFENPEMPSIFPTSYNTVNTDEDLVIVSEYEFWHLESSIPSKVTLTWNEQSNVDELGGFLSDLKVVGWSKIKKQWINLGNTKVLGDLTTGSITSIEFIPDDYEILTIGGSNDFLEKLDNITLDNYFMTPNGDGKNDFLVIDGIENSPNNSLQIYNRYGRLVYSRNNYNNEFDGLSNVNGVIAKNSGLASGIYYYIVSLNDIDVKHQGYLYLSTYVNN
ncbi:gliding motility-associated C-terminal domain-containing protein [Maribacter sedimenticola]|uniref:Gliding motility-associated C-terminal domain-containing protein n=2 Tax=Maribacter sedimenticola TaxID=228956 RepID=A0ABY1SLG5_9FLAO|nr:gliding motility-associated C-terminal domain-containing protein [Maribacter sedimenticola]